MEILHENLNFLYLLCVYVKMLIGSKLQSLTCTYNAR